MIRILWLQYNSRIYNIAPIRAGNKSAPINLSNGMTKKEEITLESAKKNRSFKKEALEFLVSGGIALLAAIIFRSLILDPFHVPSGSMIPTLLPGDKMMVSKMSYGYSSYSFPMNIIKFRGRIFSKNPQRGDIVVFVLPSDNKTFYVKRVVGLPGDIVQVKDGAVFVNNKMVKRRLITTAKDLDHNEISGNSFSESFHGSKDDFDLFEETNHEGKTYETLNSNSSDVLGQTPEFHVPEGHYFMMGDNRDNSLDSRFDKVGFVPFENIIGKPKFIFFSSEKNIFFSVIQPKYIRWKRIFKSLAVKSATDQKEKPEGSS